MIISRNSFSMTCSYAVTAVCINQGCQWVITNHAVGTLVSLSFLSPSSWHVMMHFSYMQFTACFLFNVHVTSDSNVNYNKQHQLKCCIFFWMPACCFQHCKTHTHTRTRYKELWCLIILYPVESTTGNSTVFVTFVRTLFSFCVFASPLLTSAALFLFASLYFFPSLPPPSPGPLPHPRLLAVSLPSSSHLFFSSALLEELRECVHLFCLWHFRDPTGLKVPFPRLSDQLQTPLPDHLEPSHPFALVHSAFDGPCGFTRYIVNWTHARVAS